MVHFFLIIAVHLLLSSDTTSPAIFLYHRRVFLVWHMQTSNTEQLEGDAWAVTGGGGACKIGSNSSTYDWSNNGPHAMKCVRSDRGFKQLLIAMIAMCGGFNRPKCVGPLGSCSHRGPRRNVFFQLTTKSAIVQPNFNAPLFTAIVGWIRAFWNGYMALSQRNKLAKCQEWHNSTHLEIIRSKRKCLEWNLIGACSMMHSTRRENERDAGNFLHLSATLSIYPPIHPSLSICIHLYPSISIHMHPHQYPTISI